MFIIIDYLPCVMRLDETRIIDLSGLLGDELAFGVDGNAVEICALNNVEIPAGNGVEHACPYPSRNDSAGSILIARYTGDTLANRATVTSATGATEKLTRSCSATP